MFFATTPHNTVTNVTLVNPEGDHFVRISFFFSGNTPITVRESDYPLVHVNDFNLFDIMRSTGTFCSVWETNHTQHQVPHMSYYDTWQWINETYPEEQWARMEVSQMNI